jgi:LysM repeat protein
MRNRSPARWLAPLALVTCAVAVYAVVHESISSSSDEKTPSSTSPTRKRRTTTTPRTTATKPATYTVKPGDVLSAIAEKTGTTVEELQRLNPAIDVSTLHPGQKLKLPR